ncbi:hypothetical protein GQ42DRAFT_170852 [Ramicandelaber brevisporus]|nr:hypothetical protein GQ42DRAFT_170852 [Ramicandelaber brevisporus]
MQVFYVLINGKKRLVKRFSTLKQITTTASSGVIRVTGVQDTFSLPPKLFLNRKDRVAAVPITKQVGNTICTNYPAGVLTFPHLEHFVPAGTADRLPSLDQTRKILNKTAEIVQAAFNSVKAVCSDLPRCRACWPLYGKWLCNQLHQAIRKACPDVYIPDLTGGKLFECNDCHRSKSGSADSTNTVDTATETDNLARIFAADPGAIELFVGSSSFTPLFFVHRLYVMLVNKLMDELIFDDKALKKMVLENRIQHNKQDDDDMLVDDDDDIVVVVDDDDVDDDDDDDDDAIPGDSPDIISTAQARQVRRLKKQLADFLYSGGVHYSLSRSRWWLKRGGRYRALAKEHVNELELQFVEMFHAVVVHYLGPKKQQPHVIEDALFNKQKRDEIIRGILGRRGEYVKFFDTAAKMLPDTVDNNNSVRILVEWLDYLLCYFAVMVDWQNDEIYSWNEHQNQRFNQEKSSIIPTVLRNRGLISSDCKLAGRINDSGYWMNRFAAKMVCNSVYDRFQPGTRVVAFVGDAFHGGAGAKNAASILRESILMVDVCEHNSSKLCFICNSATISPVTFANKLHHSSSMEFRSRLSYLATKTRQQQRSRRRDRLCLSCKRLYNRDFGASINMAQIALHAMYVSFMQRTRNYEVTDDKQYWPPAFRRGRYYQIDKRLFARYKRNVKKREAKAIIKLTTHDTRSAVTASLQTAVNTQQRVLEQSTAQLVSEKSKITDFLSRIKRGGWLTYGQRRILGIIKSKLHSIENKIKAAKDLIELNGRKIEAIGNTKGIGSAKQASSSRSVQRADSEGGRYRKYSTLFSLLKDTNPPPFNF